MNKIICDLHVHSKYSCDAFVELEDYCVEAINKGINIVCFTEHLDGNPVDSGYNYYKQEAFFDEFLSLKKKYQDKLMLLCGLEFSEPHLYQESLNAYGRLPYDFILGSVHYWYKDMSVSKMVRENVPVDLCFKYYWKEVLATAKAGGFDCLGHIDFPKRYYNHLIYDKDSVYEICQALVKNNIYLEINTSPIRRKMGVSMPDRDILSIYKDCGGKYVTIGSDSHNVNDIGADNLYAKNLIEELGLEEVVFIQRKPYPVSKISL